MKRRVLCVVMVVAMALCLAACGGAGRAPTDIKKKDKMTDFMYIFIAVTSYDKRRQR